MREWLKKQWNEKQVNWIAVAAIFLLAMVCIPLLMLSHYNFPSGDDFCFGGDVYRALKSNAGFYAVLSAGLAEWKQYYFNWQGTYVATFLHIFQLGGKFVGSYFLTTYFLLGVLVFTSIVFYRKLFGYILKCDSKTTLFLTFFWISAELIFVPGLVESVYWFVGGAAYTFFYSILLFFWAIMFRIQEKREKTNGLYILAAIFLIVLGGGNYVTGLLTVELLILYIVVLWKNKIERWKECILLIIYIIAFLMNICAPGTAVRQDAHINLPIWESIFKSLQVGAYFMRLWTHGYIIILILMVIPFIILGVKRTEYAYKYPVVFTALSFCIWCSNMTPSIYVNGTWGADRIIAIVYYQYFLWLILNLAYWIGWINHKYGKYLCSQLGCLTEKNFWKRKLIPYLGGMGIIFIISLLIPGYLKSVNPILAIQSIRSGEAQQYRTEQLERWKYLETTDSEEVELEPLSVRPVLLYHDDIQTDVSDWRNSGMADFFDKKSVKIKE